MDFKFVLPSPLKDFLLSEALLYTLHSDEEKPISPLKDLHFQSFFKGIRASAGKKKKKWSNVCRFSPQFNKPGDRKRDLY